MKSCKGCIYYRPIATGCEPCCNYAIDTGRVRGCTIEGCTKKETARKEQSQKEINKK